MADVQRGDRIRARREELHLTQPAVVDLIEKAAYQLPVGHDLHPDKAGKAPVTLRGLQAWERGGGIVWEKAKLLADVLHLDVQEMMSGDRGETPDLSNGKSEPDLAGAIAEFSQAIRKQNELLARQSAVLERIEKALDVDQQAKADSDESARRLLAATDEASRILRDASPRPAATRGKPAKSR